MKFTLNIDLGSEAMMNTGDVANSLREVSEKLINSRGREYEPEYPFGGIIMDMNGNIVGTWDFEDVKEEG